MTITNHFNPEIFALIQKKHKHQWTYRKFIETEESPYLVLLARRATEANVQKLNIEYKIITHQN